MKIIKELRELENHNKNIKEQTIRDIKDEIESGESQFDSHFLEETFERTDE